MMTEAEYHTAYVDDEAIAAYEQRIAGETEDEELDFEWKSIKDDK